ncbi:uncharacterized protein BDZ99DRAFT_456968 [Mytilinidion resinicola]|uniref:Uncharacterized protein n=1 Tax=Mytilinidion resinicola TaxID=574789 RepID=A0A6A6Z7X1_9PEZI|nr:uncharacterized protein BDZ99DRAFT_456968 [Mytilinidion resinicola]KAF2817212.1 hypothetical protein BDZ99DRAFT_456968 [Mytilinidion resinicola]
MRSNTKRHEAASSLEDSSYELLNDGSVESDDEGRTESLASVDGNTPDDMSSVADTEESDDDSFIFETSEPRSNTMASSASPPFGYTSSNDAGASSLATTRGDTRQQPAAMIEFVESDWRPEQDDVSSTYIYQTLQGVQNMPDVIKQYGYPEIRITFKQSLSKIYMPPKRPFRILIAGAPTDWVRDEAIKKIASALAAGRNSISDSSSSSQQSSSRFSVIRVPTETGYSTNLQLIDSTDIELTVDQCVGASRYGASFAAVTVLHMSDGKDLPIAASKFDKVPVILPDIAIFCHPDAPAYQLSHSLDQIGQHQLIRKALESQSIPILDIATVVPFRQCPESYIYGSKSLRLCVEGRGPGEIEFRVLETLPINITSFLDINPDQLNRHLAYLLRSGSGVLSTANATASEKIAEASQSRPGLASAVSDWISGKTEWWTGVKNTTTRIWQSRAPLFAVAVLVLSLITAGMLGQQAGVYNRLYNGQTSQPIVSSSSVLSWNPAPVTGPPQVSVAAIQTAMQNAKDLVQSYKDVVHSTKDISKQGGETSLGLPYTDTLSPPKLNDSKEFKVHIIGDHHFVLTPPQQFLKLRKPPTLFVRVVRTGHWVPSSVSKLNQGVFAVELERQHASGLLNITIWTESKPLIAQNFTVSFGSPWLKLSAWAKSAGILSETVKNDVALAQTGLKTVSNSLIDGLRNGRLTVEHGTTALIHQTTFWTEKAKRSSQSVSEHLQEAKREAAQQVAVGYRASKGISQRLHRGWQTTTQVPATIWQATRSARTSRSVLRARRNSQKLWRKLGLPGLPEDNTKNAPSCERRMGKPCKKHSRRSGR